MKKSYLISTLVVTGLIILAVVVVASKTVNMNCAELGDWKQFSDTDSGISGCIPNTFSRTDATEVGLHTTNESDILIEFKSTDGRRFIISNLGTGYENGEVIESKAAITTKSGQAIERHLVHLDQNESDTYRYHGNTDQDSTDSQYFWFDGTVQIQTTQADTAEYDKIIQTITLNR